MHRLIESAVEAILVVLALHPQGPFQGAGE